MVKLRRLLEFFFIGLMLGIAEDVIAVTVSTGEPITWKMIGIIALVALPFAVFSELIVDRIEIKMKNNGKKRKK